MVRYIREDELYHYGRSIKDGAPGVGTGNWRRGGGARSESAVRQEYYRIRKEERNGIYSKNKHQGSPHYVNPLDYRWKEVINASDLDGPINVAGQIAKDENFLKRVSSSVTFDQIRADVNSDWGAPGTTNNCKKCTAAQEIRRRGYDVVAGRSFGGGNSAAMTYWFDGATQYVEHDSDAFVDRLISVFGNNGRGEITFSYPNGGGHSVYAYRDDSGYAISDGQSNVKISGRSWFSVMAKAEKHYGFGGEGYYTCTRLDTATPNWDHLEKDSVLRVNYKNTNMNQIYNSKLGSYGVLWDARSGNVSVASRRMLLDANPEREESYGYSLRKDPWEFGNDYYRIPYKRSG